MKKLYLVLVAHGGHEPDSIFSVWSSRKKAEKEISRLKKATDERGNPLLSRETPGIAEIELNKSYNIFHDSE